MKDFLSWFHFRPKSRQISAKGLPAKTSKYSSDMKKYQSSKEKRKFKKSSQRVVLLWSVRTRIILLEILSKIQKKNNKILRICNHPLFFIGLSVFWVPKMSVLFDKKNVFYFELILICNTGDNEYYFNLWLSIFISLIIHLQFHSVHEDIIL